MISRAQSGSRAAPRGSKPVMCGLMSSTGDPSTASSPRTRRVRPCTPSRRQVQAVRPRRAALREDPDARPVRAAARMARVALDRRGIQPVEDEDHEDVAEGVESERGLGAELRRIERDLRLHRVPGIIHRLCPAAAHLADRRQRDAHWKMGTDCGSGMLGGGRSMMTVLGSTCGPRSRNQVTLSGQAMTIATSRSCRQSHGMAPR